jgi:3'-phosphoadenosine 5'-phosphosulfate sulfotransferase (PAPS reductase)/FAD synthetase
MPDSLFSNAVVEQYAGIEGRDLIAQVARDYAGRVALLSSFGAESSVLLHMVSEVAPDLPIIFLDTQKLFPETIAYRDQLVRELGLSNLQIVSRRMKQTLRAPILQEASAVVTPTYAATSARPFLWRGPRKSLM